MTGGKVDMIAHRKHLDKVSEFMFSCSKKKIRTMKITLKDFALAEAFSNVLI